MKKIICVLLLLLAIFSFCSCSETHNTINNESDSSSNSSVIENFSSKNNSTSYNSSSKPQSGSSVNADSSVDVYRLPIPNAKKTPDTLSKDEVYDIVVDNFDVELSKNININWGEIQYYYNSYYFTWSHDSDYPFVLIHIKVSLNSDDFNNLLNQLKDNWKVGKIDRMPYIPYEYEYIKDYTFEKKYKDVVIAEIKRQKTIYINKIKDNEYIAEFDGTFYNPEFKSGTFDIQKDGTGKKRDMSDNGWKTFTD